MKVNNNDSPNIADKEADREGQSINNQTEDGSFTASRKASREGDKVGFYEVTDDGQRTY